MSGVNKVILIGHLGRDPEVRTFENGTKKASFSLATSETYRDKDGQRVDVTEWHNVVCWRNLAEIAERYLTKGKQIYVEGKIKTRSWEDGGVKKYITEIEASTFTMLGTKSDSGNSGVSKMPTSKEEESPTPEVEMDSYAESDDLPF